MKTKNEKLINVLNNKIKRTVENNETKIQRALMEFEETTNNIDDYIVDMGKESSVTPIFFNDEGKISFTIPTVKNKFHFHRNALIQAGAKFNINGAYLSRLHDGPKWQKDLCSVVLNEHIKNEDRQRILLRSVNNQVRGFLSDKYRRMNSKELTMAFLSSVYKQKGTILDAHFDGLKSWLEVIHPEIIEIETEYNGKVGMVFGVQFSSSDFGDGALDLRVFTMQGVCLNGMVKQSLLRQIHLGKRIPDDILISNKTHELDTEAQASLITDIVGQVFTPESINREKESIQKASLIKIKPATELLKLPKLGVSKEEIKSIESVLMENKSEDGLSGEPTLWKFAQAVSCISRNHESGRRSRELQEISGKLLERIN